MTRSGYRLYASAMSISPDVGHGPYLSGSSGHSQSDSWRPFTIAGGNLARTSKRPPVWLNRPLVDTDPLVYCVVKSPFGSVHVNGAASLRAVRWSAPSETDTLSGVSTKHSVPEVNPEPEVCCGTHLVRSRVVPSKSSTNVQSHGVPSGLVMPAPQAVGGARSRGGGRRCGRGGRG